MAEDSLFDVGGELAKQKRAALEIMVNEGVPASAALERAAETITKRRDESLAALEGFGSQAGLGQAQAVARRPADAALIALGLEQGVFENQVERRRRALDDLFGGIESAVPLVQAETERAYAEALAAARGRGGGGGGSSLSKTQATDLAINQARDRLAQAVTIEDPLFQQIQKVAHGENALAGLESIDAMLYASNPSGMAKETAANREVAKLSQKLAQLPQSKTSSGAQTKRTVTTSSTRQKEPSSIWEMIDAAKAADSSTLNGSIWDAMKEARQPTLAPSVQRAVKEAQKVGALLTPQMSREASLEAERAALEEQRRTAVNAALQTALESRGAMNAPLLAAFGVQRTNARPGSLANVLPGFTADQIGYDPDFGYFVDTSFAPPVGTRYNTYASGPMKGLVDRTVTFDPVTGLQNPIEALFNPEGFMGDVGLLTEAARMRAVELGLDPLVAEAEITSDEVVDALLGSAVDQLDLIREYAELLNPDLADQIEAENRADEAVLQQLANQRALDFEQTAAWAMQNHDLTFDDVQTMREFGEEHKVPASKAIPLLTSDVWTRFVAKVRAERAAIPAGLDQSSYDKAANEAARRSQAFLLADLGDPGNQEADMFGLQEAKILEMAVTYLNTVYTLPES